jgi:hypothetical protein
MTLSTRFGEYAVFAPRACLRIENNRLVIVHPCEAARLVLERSDVLRISRGVSIMPEDLGTREKASAAYPNLDIKPVADEMHADGK